MAATAILGGGAAGGAVLTSEDPQATPKLCTNVPDRLFRDSVAAASIASDYATVEWLFPNFDYRWLVAEVRESLPKDGERSDSDFLDVAIKELELLVEARNSEKCPRNFQKLLPHTDRIYVPLVYWNLSTSILLTVEFMDGMRVDDVKGIQNMGIRPYHVSKLVSEDFAEMIFKHGFVHCDPHAANLLVRPLPSGKRTI